MGDNYDKAGKAHANSYEKDKANFELDKQRDEQDQYYADKKNGMTGSVTNEMKPEYIQTYDFTRDPSTLPATSDAAEMARRQNGYNTFMANQAMLNNQYGYNPATDQASMQQAMRNVRGVGNAYGQYGAAQSGAAASAAAEGANSPYVAAKAQMDAQKAQAMQKLYDTYSGIVMPTLKEK